MTPPPPHPIRSSLELRVRPWSLLTAAGAVAAAATLLGFLGRSNWLLDLFSHFRLQYFLGLSAVALLLLIPRRRRLALCFGAVALLNLTQIAPLYFPPREVSVPEGRAYRAMLINVNTHYGNPRRVMDAVMSRAPDILVLEEVSAEWLRALSSGLRGYPHSLSEPRDDNFGIALYSRFPLNTAEIVGAGEYGVPSVVAEIRLPSGPLTVIGTHPVPPKNAWLSRERNAQLEQLPAWAAAAASPVLLLGDLNVSPWNHRFRRLLRDTRLQDSARGRGVQSTWPCYTPGFMRIPIDHCLHTPEIRIHDRAVGPDVGSDHFPLIVDFTLVH